MQAHIPFKKMYGDRHFQAYNAIDLIPLELNGLQTNTHIRQCLSSFNSYCRFYFIGIAEASIARIGRDNGRVSSCSETDVDTTTKRSCYGHRQAIYFTIGIGTDSTSTFG